MTTTLGGGCHCGNIKVAFETAVDPVALPLRACRCSFCRRHGGITTSDPAGRLVVEVRRPEPLQRYRFELGITDFLICRTCGVYVAAVMETDGRVLGVLNINVLDDPEPFARSPAPMEYGAEKVEERKARRAKVWMPVEVKRWRMRRAELDGRFVEAVAADHGLWRNADVRAEAALKRACVEVASAGDLGGAEDRAVEGDALNEIADAFEARR